jgi:hypothetical protein
LAGVDELRISLRTVLIIALATAGLWQGYKSWQLRPVHPPDGQIAPDGPRQTDADDAQVTVHGRWRLTPRARYDITARILGREDYHFDLLADLIPEDLALGWGPMSDNRVLGAFEIAQGARFYSWVPTRDLPIPRQAVIEHSANTHVIPADLAVAGQLRRLRVGQVVHLSGFLVNAVRDDGAYINTSLTRSDSGPGSCEVVLVEQVEAW